MKILVLVVLFILSSSIHADNTLEFYRDFFHVKTNNKTVRYVPVIKIWTNIDREKLKDATINALKIGITNVIAGEKEKGAEALSIPSIKKSFEEAILKEFVNFSFIKEIINKDIQTDIYFVPVLDSPNDFSNELGTNELIDMSQMGNLMSKIRFTRNPFEYKRLKKVYDHIIKSSSSEKYTYLGGVISVSMRILDSRLNWSIVPKTRKNAIKGFIRYRRHFESKGFKENSISKEDMSIKAEYKNSNLNNFMTVDLVKTFSIGNIVPSFHSVTTHFGMLLDAYDNKMSDDLFDKPITYRQVAGPEGEPIYKNQKYSENLPTFKGKKKGFLFFGDENFNYKVQRLTYLFKTESFSQKDSHFFKDNGEEITVNYKDISIQKSLLENYKEEIMDMFNFERFIDLSQVEVK